MFVPAVYLYHGSNSDWNLIVLPSCGEGYAFLSFIYLKDVLSLNINDGWFFFLVLNYTEHSGQADQKDQPGAGGGNELMERTIHGGHYSQCR